MLVSQSMNTTISLKNGQKNQHKMNHSHTTSSNQPSTKHEHFVHEKPTSSTAETNHASNSNNHETKHLAPNTNTNTNTETKDEIDASHAKLESADALEYWQILKRSVIEGEKVKLVPYCEHHVKQYNEWLNDSYIQQMTNSEPYSLEQEYEFQKEWNESDTKYIFIILDKTLDKAEPPMAGDINIFIQDEYCGELNVMIAEQQSRRKGLASETLSLVIEWAKTNLEIKRFIAKIQHDNHSSIALFKKLGFQQTDYVDAFKEYTFSLTFENELYQQYNARDQKQIDEEQENDDNDESDSEPLSAANHVCHAQQQEPQERQTSDTQQNGHHTQAITDGAQHCGHCKHAEHCNDCSQDTVTAHSPLATNGKLLHLHSDKQYTD